MVPLGISIKDVRSFVGYLLEFQSVVLGVAGHASGFQSGPSHVPEGTFRYSVGPDMLYNRYHFRLNRCPMCCNGYPQEFRRFLYLIRPCPLEFKVVSLYSGRGYSLGFQLDCLDCLSDTTY